MKNVYVVEVHWYEDERWHHTIINVFSNKSAAQSYADEKQKQADEHPTDQHDEYTVQRYGVWSKNYLSKK